MKIQISIISLSLVVFFLSGFAAIAFSKTIPNSYIVQFNNNTDIKQMVRSGSMASLGQIKHTYSHAIKGFSIRLPKGKTKANLLALPGVISVEPDLEIRPCAQTVPTGVRRINIPQNGFAKIDGIDERVDVNVAIMDSGIDADHPDLNIYADGSRNFTSTDPANWNDTDGHGTMVAGVVGALDNDIGTVGVAPGARLWALKILSDGSGSTGDVIDAVDYVTENADQIQVVNMSFSATGRGTTLRSAIQNSIAAGVVYVAAAGNDFIDIYGSDGTFFTSDDTIPAAYPDVLTVSALADSDGLPGGLGTPTSDGPDDSFASLSNYSQSVTGTNPVTSPGAAIDLIMPGISIRSTYIGGGTATASGTSMASPHAAGLVALYIAANGRAINASDVYAIRQTLINGGIAQTDLRGLDTLNDPDINEEKLGYYVRSDFNYDSFVDYLDFDELIFFWLQNDPVTDIAPLGGDGTISFLDYSLFMSDFVE